MNVSTDLDVTGSSAGSSTVIGTTQGTVHPVMAPVVPLTFGLAAGTDGLFGFTADEALPHADVSGPSVSNMEEVATTGDAGTTDQSLSGTGGQFTDPTDVTVDSTAAQLTSGKLTSLNIHISLIIAFGNQIK